jgi:hypothetical protein
MSNSFFQLGQTAMYSRLIHKERFRGCLYAPIAGDSKKESEIVPIDRRLSLHFCGSVLRDCDFQLSLCRGRISIHLLT